MTEIRTRVDPAFNPDLPYEKVLCERCGHSPDDHRLDDALNIPPTDPAAPFRCLGPNFDGCDVACPDFVGEPLRNVR